MIVRKLHAWDEWHEADHTAPPRQWSNIEGTWEANNDAAHPTAWDGGGDASMHYVDLYYGNPPPVDGIAQSGRIVYRWSMKPDAASPAIDMSLYVCATGTAFGDKAYRIQQTAANLKFISLNAAGAETTEVSVALAAVVGSEYYYGFDVNLSTGAYYLWRGAASDAAPDLTDANLRASGTASQVPATGIKNIIVRCQQSTDAYYDHLKVNSQNLPNVFQIDAYSVVTEGVGSFKLEIGNPAGDENYPYLSLFDTVEILSYDMSIPAEYCELTGWVEEIIDRDYGEGYWTFTGRDLRAMGLVRNMNDTYAALALISASIAGAINTYIPRLTNNDVKGDLATFNNNHTCQGITVLDGITQMMRMIDEDWYHLLTPDRRFLITDLWRDMTATTLDETEGRFIKVHEPHDGKQLANQVRMWYSPVAGTPPDIVNDATSQGANGHIRTLDVFNPRMVVAGDSTPYATTLINTYAAQQRCFEIAVADHIELYPGDDIHLNMPARGINNAHYTILWKKVGWPAPGVPVYFVAPTGARQRFVMNENMAGPASQKLGHAALEYQT